MRFPHLCLLDWDCWKQHWLFGMPMRLYWGDQREHFVPVWPLNGVMHWWRWRGAVPVEVVPPPGVFRHVLAGDRWVNPVAEEMEE